MIPGFNVSTARENSLSGPIAQFAGIEKSFFGVKVLKNVTFDVGRGRITGLIGENGAGKSTLMNLLGGNLRPDAGALRVDGVPHAPANPEDARRAGIAFVHQELNLFPNLSVAENLYLTSFPCRKRMPLIHRRQLHTQARRQLERVGLRHDPATPVARLSAGERQLLEIAKGLAAEARLIILDEPTTSLSTPECERLFRLLQELRGDGYSMIYISHALGDVLRLCDDVVVLRDGEVVTHGLATEFDQDRLVALMVGRPLVGLYPERQRSRPEPTSPDGASAAAAPLFQVQNLSQPGVIRNISFTLSAGEIVGVAGLMGAGRSELARILFGLDPAKEGEIRLNGEKLSGPPQHRIRRGLAFLTEDRRQEGLCLEASIADNLALVTLPSHARTPVGWLDFSGLRSAIRRLRETLRLSLQAADGQPVRTLSGGNQQKVVLGKWLLAEPKVFLLDEPTRGVDVGAKFEIYQLIQQLAERGAGVLVISSEIEELMGICDRLLVMRQGAITGEFRREEFDREKILGAALHASRMEVTLP